MTRRWRRTTCLAAILAVAGAALVTFRVWFPGRPFDAAAWQADANIGSGTRQAKADGLLTRHPLIGKTRAEVVKLLGEPPPTEYFSEWDLVYRLGPERGFLGIDSEWLVLRLGTGGRVAEARLVTD